MRCSSRDTVAAAGHVLTLFWLMVVLSCGEDAPTAIDDRALDTAGKPAVGDPTVVGTDPMEAPQDTTLDVRVLGTNFDRGSRADLALNCEIECFLSEKVKTNTTRYVSSGELVANITIAADAVVELYDVLITTSKGKRGIGIELFAIKVGHPNPQTGYTEFTVDRLPGAKTCEGIALNEHRDVTGFCSYQKADRRAFLWRMGGEVVDLGLGHPEDLSDFGDPIVVGQTGPPETRVAAVWGSGGSPAVVLPQLAVDGCSGGAALGVNGAGDLVAGYACKVVGGATRSIPVTWTGSGSNWSEPQPLPLPDGYYGGRGVDVSTNGVILGHLFSEDPEPDGARYFVWFPPYLSAQRVPPGGYTYLGLFSVNDNGDVVGTTTAVRGWESLLWRRNGSTWDSPVNIGGGSARGVNLAAQVTGIDGNEVYVWSASAGKVYLDQGIGYDINDRGDIVGTYLMNERAVLWLAP